MYNFSYFKENDEEVILQFLEENPLALISGSFKNGNPVATQVPVLIEKREGDWYIQGHIMRNTDHHKAFNENPNVLAVFSAANCYVSATWCTDPHGGSTWNYMSAHMYGKIRFMSDEELINFMKRFTLKFENGNTQSETIYDNLPSEYLKKYMPAIIGFELKAERMDNSFKLSQNKDLQSFENIINELNKSENYKQKFIAKEMEKRKNKIFNK